jgi:acetylornithine deacetylase
VPSEIGRLIRSSVLDLSDDLVAWLRALVRIPSVTGEEQAAQGRMEELLRALDMKVDVFWPRRDELEGHPSFSDDGLPLGDRPVVVGTRKGARPGPPALILNGHMDVVPTGHRSLWPADPWDGRIEDGAVWGRGSCDMKAGLVAGLGALAALRDAGLEPPGDVLFQSVIGEETGGAGTLSCVLRGYRADAAVVLEPTRLSISPVGAGAAGFRLSVPGKAGHAALREEGVSAIEKFQILHAALGELERTRHHTFSHEAFAPGALVAPISVGRLSAGDWPSTVPDALVAEGRCGVFPGERIADARHAMEVAVAGAAEGDEWLREHPPSVEWFEGQFEPAECPLDAPIVERLGAAVERSLGTPAEVRGVTYGSDLRFFTNEAGMQAVLFGPGDVRLAHSTSERVPIEEVLRAAEILALLILDAEDL